jgi:hypothetical protein
LTAQVGGISTLSGALTSAGQPLSGAPVEIQRRSAEGYETVASAVTGDDGTWSVTAPLTRNAAVRAVYRGGESSSAVVSETVGVRIPAQLTIQAQTQTAVTGVPVQLDGTVFPAKRGITLFVTRLAPDGGYGSIREIAVRSSGGSWSQAVTFDAPGRYQVVAASASDRLNAAGVSAPVEMTVA